MSEFLSSDDVNAYVSDYHKAMVKSGKFDMATIAVNVRSCRSNLNSVSDMVSSTGVKILPKNRSAFYAYVENSVVDAALPQTDKMVSILSQDGQASTGHSLSDDHDEMDAKIRQYYTIFSSGDWDDSDVQEYILSTAKSKQKVVKLDDQGNVDEAATFSDIVLGHRVTRTIARHLLESLSMEERK